MKVTGPGMPESPGDFEWINQQRAELEQIDQELLTLIFKRYEKVIKLLEQKYQSGLSLWDETRVQYQLSRVSKVTRDPLAQVFLMHVYGFIIKSGVQFFVKNFLKDLHSVNSSTKHRDS